MTFIIPTLDTPELQAYFVGFALPFICAALGFLVGVVRSLLHRVNDA